MRFKNIDRFIYPERPGEAHDRRLRGRINWNTCIGVDTDVASNINHYSTLTTLIRPHKSLREQSSTDHAIL